MKTKRLSLALARFMGSRQPVGVYVDAGDEFVILQQGVDR